MTKQEFIDQIDGRSEEIGCFDLFDSGEDIEIIIPQHDIKITFNEENTFNIYRDFCYPLKDCEENFENEYQTVLQEATEKLLEAHLGIHPCVEYECGYGCPFDSSLVGYWNRPYDTDFIVEFVKISEMAEAENHQNAVEKLIMESILNQSQKFRLTQNDEYSLISMEKDLVISPKEILSFNARELDSESFEQVILPVFATRYFCGKTKTDKRVAVSITPINLFFDLCDCFHVDKSDFDFYSDGKEYLYIKGKLNAILPLESKYNEIIDSEYSLLVRKLDTLKKIKPQLSDVLLDFSHLTYSDFERLCYDILIKQGFIDVHPVGKSNASDGGKDILATEEYITITGTESRKWIWQCKHSKKSLSRKDVSEIGDLLQENNADAYGLFCSNSLTPDLINRLELKKSNEVRIFYYGVTELNTLLSQHSDLLGKYKLLGGAGR